MAVALLLPLAFYAIIYFLSKGKMPHAPKYYYVERIDSNNVNGRLKRDTVYHSVGNLSLINQLGHTITTNADLKNKILVFSFIDAANPTSAQLMQSLDTLQKAFKRDNKKEYSLDSSFQILSITTNPSQDSFPVLRHYADSFHVNHDYWWLLTADKQRIYDFAAKELKAPIPSGTFTSANYPHQLVLVDKNRHIRGYYNGLDPNSVNQCAQDIVLLIFTPDHPRKH